MLHAVRDTVLVEIVYEEKIHGFWIPDQAKQYHGDLWGRIISVGPDYPYELKPGDAVFFRRHEGFKVLVDDKTYWSLREKWVVARIEKGGI